MRICIRAMAQTGLVIARAASVRRRSSVCHLVPAYSANRRVVLKRVVGSRFYLVAEETLAITGSARP